MTHTVDVLNASVDRPASLERSQWAIGTSHAIRLLQLGMAASVVYLYAIEGRSFLRLFLLATAGFAINLALPMRMRQPFFVLLSFVGIFIVFGPADAAWLIACGLTLIGICHLPIAYRVRVAMMLALAALLAASRSGLVASPWSAAVWPILGSMFMFRLVLYMLATKTQRDVGLWPALAYFFMLPNLAFPLFPVVDYQTFRRTYYDRPHGAIYEQGLLWIVRGLVHLLAYRFVYYNLLNDPARVNGLHDVVQFMLATFLLYLRVSGQFHLIVGLLHLFGFRLPETHKLYYLAHSFTELWRRINIYWTDFMMKVVFYPTYFKVKRLGPTWALAISTTAVFLVTWLLHSYQWFWLRGGFPLTLPDVLFWGILGALVVKGALNESKAVKKPRQRVAVWSVKLGLHAAITFSLFCVLWSLWSANSIGEWLWMLVAAANVDLGGVMLIVLAFTTVLIIGGRDWNATTSPSPKWLATAMSPTIRTVVPLIVLLVIAQPAVQGMAPKAVAAGLRSLQTTGLNARDSALQQRGYYEQLDVRTQLNDRVAEVIDRRNANWETLGTTGILRERKHDVLTRDLEPSRSAIWNGHQLSTNRWGMRDKDYTMEKPATTLRIALLGPSVTMGSGVSDGETFESLVEARLNREFHDERYASFEVLNFAVDGQTVPEQVAMLEDRVFAFHPDIVIATHFFPAASLTERYLRKLVWNGVTVKDPSLRALLARAGLDEPQGDVAVPFSSGRRVARWLGYNPRIPMTESVARIRWIADDVVEWSLRRFAQVTREHGAVPLVLGLNAVIDNAPPRMPQERAIQDARLPVIDLFDVYPAMARPALRAAEWDDHPNAAGHKLIADRLYAELTRFIESSQLHANGGGIDGQHTGDRKDVRARELSAR